MGYDHFAEFITEHITSADVRNLNKEFAKDLFSDRPELIIEKLDEFFMNKWKDNADPSPRTGNAISQRKNFENFLRKQLLTREKTVYKDPYTKQDISFDPYFAKYREVTGELVKPPVVSRRVEELVRVPKIEEDIKRISPGVFVRRVEKQIQNSQKAGHVDNLLTIRDAMRDMSFRPSGERPVDTLKAQELYNKANEALQPYFEKGSRFGTKSDNELRIALSLEGVDVSGLLTSDQLRKSAKDNDIGTRRYQKTRNELVRDITSIGPYNKEELSERPTPNLKELWKNLKRELRTPTRKFYVNLEDLPSDQASIKELYKKQGRRVTPKIRESVQERVQLLYPFLSPEEMLERTNRRIASRISETPVIDREMEKRYMNWRYDEPERNPGLLDLINLSNVTNNQFKLHLTSRADPIPKEAFSSYRKRLKEEVTKAKNIIEQRSQEQTEQFLTEEEEEF